MTKALAKQVQTPENVSRQLAVQHSSVKKSDFYSVGGKTIPSARALQKFANTQKISSEVVRLEWQHHESFYTASCTAYVRAWIGSKEKPKQETTQAVTLSMVGIIQRYVTKKLTARQYAWPETDVQVDANGRILPVAKKRQMEMLSYLADQYTFLDRSAITKAESRAFDKLLRPDAVEYDDEHEASPPPAHVDVETGEVTDDEPETPDPTPPADDEPADPQPPPREAEDPTVEPSFPPTEKEMADHNDKVNKLGKEKVKLEPPPPPTLGAVARGIIEAIEKAGSYRSSLEKLGTTLTEAKNTIPAGEYAQVMQAFWKAHAAAK